MKTKKYNIAIIGTGRITKAHLDALNNIHGFNVAGIYGRDFARANKLASESGIKAFSEFQEILSNPEIHIVDITTSSDLHADYGIEAARYGKNLIIEKPIDASVNKAEELVQICNEKNCIIGVVYQLRFDETAVLLKKLIDKNIFGRLISGKIVVRQKRDTEYYKTASDKCRGVLLNNGIHYIDLIMHLLGKKPNKFSGIIKKTRQEIDVEDYASVFMEFDNSFLFSIDISTNVNQSLPTILEINGEKGSILFSGNKIKFVSLNNYLMASRPKKITGDILKLYIADKFKLPFKFQEGSHAHVFRNYLNALKGRGNVAVSGADALVSLRIVSDIYKKHSGHCNR